jgi:hypothetical protein
MLAAHPEGVPVMESDDGQLKVHVLPNITPIGTGITLSMTF